MKNWRIVWTTITSDVFSNGFDTFEELEAWLAQRAEQIKSVAATLTVWELYDNKKYQRYNWKRA